MRASEIYALYDGTWSFNESGIHCNDVNYDVTDIYVYKIIRNKLVMVDYNEFVYIFDENEKCVYFKDLLIDVKGWLF